MQIDLPAKRILKDDDATDKIDSGVHQAADIIGLTMGPKGWNVAIRIGSGAVGEGKIINTKDGVTVANHIRLEDPEEDLGAQQAVEASRRTNDAAGDGTTATVVLLSAMLKEARKRVKVGSNPILIQQGMQREKDRVVEFLQKYSNPIETDEQIYNVAYVSCQDKEIAKKISDIIYKVGKYGTVGVEAQTGPLNIDLRIQRGMYFDVGYNPQITSLSAASVQGQLQRKGSTSKLTWDQSDVGVLIFDEPVRLWSDVSHIFSACVTAERTKLLIIGDFQDDAALGLAAQCQANILTTCGISRGNFPGETGREILKDIAIFTGATFMSPSEGTLPLKINPKPIQMEILLGDCTASVTRDSFSLTSGRGTPDAITARIALINEMLEAGALSDYDKQRYKERIARFSAGIGTITIFAPTEVQQQSMRTRVDDAVCAVRSANEEGIVPGGGVMLVRCHQYLLGIDRMEKDTDICAGEAIVRQALLQPARTIADMAADPADVRLSKLMAYDWDSTWGYDYWTESECELLAQGIIDPKKVVRLCMENAVAVVGEILRTRATIVDMPKQTPDEPYLSPKERAQQAHLRRAQQGR